MKKVLIFILVIISMAAVFAGCAKQASSTAATGSAIQPSSSSSDSKTPSISIEPIQTTAPEVTPDPDAAASTGSDDDSKTTTYKGWVYYLDINDPIVTTYNEDPPLHMKKTDNTGDVNLGVRGYNFDIIGDYIYMDSNDPDPDENGTQTWSTTRMGLDGSDKKKLEYGSMSRFILKDGQNFYFTTMGDEAVYVSDFGCDNVTTLKLSLPNQSDLDTKLDKNKLLQVDISDVTAGVISFTASYLSENGTQLYSGTYKINADGSSIQKVKGTYYYYAQESD
jgi:hypothetical protein